MTQASTDQPATSAKAAPNLATQLQAVAKDIKLSHTVFALPFALLGAGLACAHQGLWPTWQDGLLLLACMFFARTAAMAMNRFSDALIDADNPRTKNRAVPSGQVSRPFMLGVVLVNGLLFVLAAGGFWFTRQNIWPVLLAVPVLLYLLGYGYTKRFTFLCHVYLGVALSISPVAAAIAMDASVLSGSSGGSVWLLACMVAGWVAGFDVIYALQDIACDQEQGLHSIPARFGLQGALWISRMLHVAAIVSLVLAWWLSPVLGVGFAIGMVLTIGLLTLEHVLVWRSGTGKIQLVFFTLNGVISLLLGALGWLDILLAR